MPIQIYRKQIFICMLCLLSIHSLLNNNQIIGDRVLERISLTTIKRLPHLGYYKCPQFYASSPTTNNNLNSNSLPSNLLPTLAKGRYEKSHRDISMDRMRKGLIHSFAIASIITSSVIASNADSTTAEAVRANIDNGRFIPQQLFNSTVMKRATDDRKYKAINLANGLRVLLISDPTILTSAAAMDVHVGSLSDPSYLPGLAHFCEHMSFLGTKKYPKEDEFSSFLSKHGGSSNAYTDAEDTVYYFGINSDFIAEALDRFAQFFISPLFTESATARELNAIESEHAKNINNDGFRVFQLEKDDANPLHPLNRFATGNKFTLETSAIAQGINTRQELLKFHQRYYSSNQMTLCVESNQELQTLEKYVNEYFSLIPNKSVPKPESQWRGNVVPYNNINTASLLEIVPIQKSSQSITISWPIWIRSQEEFEYYQKYKPEMVLSQLIGYEGVGSIHSFLMKKEWINELGCAIGNELSDLQVFEITIDLTNEGFQHRYDIIDSIFAYLDLLINTRPSSIKKSVQLPDYVYQELKQLSKINFDFSEKSDPVSLVSTLVRTMQSYQNPREYLSGPQLFLYDYNNTEDANNSYKNGDYFTINQVVYDYLNQLTPQNARVRVISQLFENQNNSNNRLFSSPFYGTKYHNLTLPLETFHWSQVSHKDYPTLTLPKPNEFIPTNFTLLSPKKTKTNKNNNEFDYITESIPTVVRHDSKWKVWHKTDDIFNQPQVYVAISLAIAADQYSKSFVNHAKIFTNCFLDSLNEELLYDAHLAGLDFQIDISSKGLQLVFSGFQDKLSLFINKVLAALSNYTPSPSSFQRIKELLKREYQNWYTLQPYNHASYYANLVSESLQFPIDELLMSLDKDCSLQQVSQLLKNSFSAGSFGTSLIIGNINCEDSLKIIENVEKSFPFIPLDESRKSKRQTALIQTTSEFLKDRIPELYNQSSASNNDNEDYFILPKILNNNKNKPLGSVGFRVKHIEPNKNDVNSACSFYYQYPVRIDNNNKINNNDQKQSTDYVYVDLLSDILEEPFYDSLRTKQQLGYIVFSGSKKGGEKSRFLMFVVQSSLLDGSELGERIYRFIGDEVEAIVNGISENDFEGFKQGLIAKRLEADQRLTSQAGRLWSEIITSSEKDTPFFTRRIQEVQSLKTIKKSDFIRFVKSFILPGGEKNRLLVSQITSQSKLKQTPETQQQKKEDENRNLLPFIEIMDELKFQNNFMKLL
eukprot:gene9001-12142_t